MPKAEYTLREIFSSTFDFKNNTVEKKIIYNKAPLGGLHNRWIKIVFFLLPILMYGAIFNPQMFAYLGIAQAIVFYIILLVFAMQVIMGLAYFNNRKVLKMLKTSWEAYFPDIELKMILSSGVTPYVDFKKSYATILNEGLDEESSYQRLKEDFKQMEKENHILYDAMNRDKQKIK
jgi:hypothetical protein